MVYQIFHVKHGFGRFSLWRWHNIKLLLKDLMFFCNLNCSNFSCNLSYCLRLLCHILHYRGDTEIQKDWELNLPPTSPPCIPVSLVLNQKSSSCFDFRELYVQAHSWRYGAAVMVTSDGKGEYNELKNPLQTDKNTTT